MRLQALPPPPDASSPYAWFAVIIAMALGVVFWQWVGSVNARTSRCETREDKLIEDNRTCLSSQKDLLSAVMKATELLDGSVALHRNTDLKIDANRSVIDEIKRSSSDILKALDEMRRAK